MSPRYIRYSHQRSESVSSMSWMCEQNKPNQQMNGKVNKLSCQHIVKLGEIAERVKRNFSTVKGLVSFAVSRTGVTQEAVKGWT